MRAEADGLTDEEGVPRAFHGVPRSSQDFVFNDGSRSPFNLDFIDFCLLISIEFLMVQLRVHGGKKIGWGNGQRKSLENSKRD